MNAYGILVRRPEGNNIIMDLGEIGWDDMDWIDPA
jgi:hypothetical protein